jgi:hypothetical protein
MAEALDIGGALDARESLDTAEAPLSMDEDIASLDMEGGLCM